MPERRTLKRARKAKREGKAPSTQAGEFVREEIEHVREGKHGARSAKQAIAIGLSKARRAGVDGRRRGYPVASFACVAGASCLAGAVMGLLRAYGLASLCGSSASTGFGWNIAGGREGSRPCRRARTGLPRGELSALAYPG